METRERFRGALFGLACGDAIGTSVEFLRRRSFAPLTDMIGGGPFSLQPGQWTDDTSMALCLATSLLDSGGFDPADQMRRYCRWMEESYLSSTGEWGNGYVVDSLEAALWCFARTATFEEAVLCAANLGDDADTTAAICGQLAGAFYGQAAIPRHWQDRLAWADQIRALADRLHDERQAIPTGARLPA